MAREDDLLARFRDDGHAASMETLVGLTRPRLVGVARRIGAPQDAEDSVQAAYHALLRRAEKPDDVVGFLVATVVRIAYRRKATARRDATLAERLARPRDESDAPRAAVRDEEDALVRAAVHRLPAIYRDAVVLHHLEGLPLADVAKLLDVPVATTKTRVQRGRALLRTPLGPLAAHGLMFVPWKFADAVRALGPAAGGAMQTKWIAAGAAALVVAGVAAGVGAYVDATPAETTTSDAAAARRGPIKRAAARRVRDEAPAAAVEPAPAAATRTEPVAPAPPAAAAKPDDSKPTPAVVDAARTLGVPDVALAAAWAAYRCVRAAPVATVAKPDELAAYRLRRLEAFNALSGCGDQALPALVALLRGGETGTYFQELMAAAPADGRERLLIDVAEDRAGPQWADTTALGCLGCVDSNASRDYLLGRLAREDHAYRFAATAQALGRLHEPRGLPLCRDKLRPRDAGWNARWTPELRKWLVEAVVKMDKDEGTRALVDCVRDPTFDLARTAVTTIGLQVDRALAKSEAAALVASGRLDAMSKPDADDVRGWAEGRR